MTNFLLRALSLTIGQYLAISLVASLLIPVMVFFPPSVLWIAHLAPGLSVFLYVYGPFVLAGIWFLAIVFAVNAHGPFALWLFATAILVIPAIFMQMYIWMCAAHNQCL